MTEAHNTLEIVLGKPPSNYHTGMNTTIKTILASLLLGLCTSNARAQSSFAGVFLYHIAEGDVIGGNLLLTFSGDHVFFESRLRDYWVDPAIGLEPAIVVNGTVVPFNLGVGTAGSWPIEAFLPPNPNPDSDPYYPYPPWAPHPQPVVSLNGEYYSGSFLAPAGLESALAAGAGQAQLQIRGEIYLDLITVGQFTVQDPLLRGGLAAVPEPSAWALIATGILLSSFTKRAGREA